MVMMAAGQWERERVGRRRIASTGQSCMLALQADLAAICCHQCFQGFVTNGRPRAPPCPHATTTGEIQLDGEKQFSFISKLLSHPTKSVCDAIFSKHGIVNLTLNAIFYSFMEEKCSSLQSDRDLHKMHLVTLLRSVVLLPTANKFAQAESKITGPSFEKKVPSVSMHFKGTFG